MTQRFFRFGVLLLLGSLSYGPVAAAAEKVLSIDSCYARAQVHFPLYRQVQALGQVGNLQQSMLASGKMPQFLIAGQASNQSAVTQLPISLPNVEVPIPDKTQYRAYAEVSQSITALHTIATQQDLIRIGTEIEQQKVQVELYKIRDRVNGLYFGILLADAQLRQNSILQADIKAGIDRATVSLAAGTVMPSDVDQLKVAQLKADQRSLELRTNRNAYVTMLAELTGMALNEDVQLEMPGMVLAQTPITRPELKLFDLQRSYLRHQERSVKDRLLPGFGFFVQSGVGRPALNMLDNQTKPYYIGGVRLNWTFSGFYTAGKERRLLRLNGDIAELQREAFLSNTRIAMQQYSAEIKKLENLVQTDVEIIRLREGIVEQFKAQLDYGTASVTDYLTQVNAADQARQQYQLHAIQLVFAKFNFKNTIGS